MQRLEVSGAVRPIYGSLGVKRLIIALELKPTRIVCYTAVQLLFCIIQKCCAKKVAYIYIYFFNIFC